jgi:DNA replication regulator DPB11
VTPIAHVPKTLSRRPAKFPNVSVITLFFPASQGAETTRIYYVGFFGQWSEVRLLLSVSLARCFMFLILSLHQRKQDPVITVYEAKPNLADHEKIQGTEGNFSMPSQ